MYTLYNLRVNDCSILVYNERYEHTSLNIVILADGTCSFDLSGMKHAEGTSTFGIKSGEVFTRDKYYYWGYEDLDSMFNKLITANIDKYSYESTVQK